MDDVEVIPNIGATNNEPVPVVPTQTESTESGNACSGRHARNRRRPLSRRAVRKAQAVNFLLYGITLLIPGVAMIIVYFVVFRIPTEDVTWSPADAFVITGAILVGFSIVSEVIGLWQFCMSRYESNDPPQDTTIRNQQYSDAPPSYDGIAAVDLPDLVVVSVSQGSEENPPSFEACFGSSRHLPGMENSAFDSVQTDDEDLPPPPEYREIIKEKDTKRKFSVSISQKTGNVTYAKPDEDSDQTLPKDDSS